jgi:hypothetical protein
MKRMFIYVAAAGLICFGGIAWISRSFAQEAERHPAKLMRRGPLDKTVVFYSEGDAEGEYELKERILLRDESSQRDELAQSERAHVDSTSKIVKQFRLSTDDQERRRLQEALAKVVSQHFDVRQQMRQRELQELEAQLARLKDVHQRREREKDQIVRDRVQQLLRDADGLGWGSGSATPRTLGLQYVPAEFAPSADSAPADLPALTPGLSPLPAAP